MTPFRLAMLTALSVTACSRETDDVQRMARLRSPTFLPLAADVDSMTTHRNDAGVWVCGAFHHQHGEGRFLYLAEGRLGYLAPGRGVAYHKDRPNSEPARLVRTHCGEP